MGIPIYKETKLHKKCLDLRKQFVLLVQTIQLDHKYQMSAQVKSSYKSLF